jgi:hypothetical protein
MIVPVVCLRLPNNVGGIKKFFTNAATRVLYIDGDGDQLVKWSGTAKGSV